MNLHTRRLVRAGTAMALCLALLCPLPVSAADLYFTATNDSLAQLTTDTMPLWSGGVLYVPYTVFDSRTNSTGIDLGVNASYSRSDGTVTLFTPRKFLVFDLNHGTCRDDLTGESYSARAIVRNGRPYLPVKTVCDFFGLTSSYTAISQGYLVRIKNSSVVLSDAKFIDAAGDLINRRVREYNQSLNPVQEPTTTPATPTTPPVSNEDPMVSATDVRTYLAFRCEDADGLPQILDVLEGRGVYALFLFTPQALEENSGLVRRILGTGHTIGLLAQGGTLDETRALLARGSRLLEQTAHLRTTVACVPKDQRAALESEGWVCWNETMVLTPSAKTGPNTFASNTLRRLKGRTLPTYLTLTGDENTARVLSVLLRQLDGQNFVASIPMETRL